MYCTRCGKELPDGITVCADCERDKVSNISQQSINELRSEVVYLQEQLYSLERKINMLAKEQRSEEAFDMSAYVSQTQAYSSTVSEASEKQPAMDMEKIVGGNWLNRIGAATLVLGIAFFLKYSIDNNWINETGRIILGLIAGIGCIGLGERFQNKLLPLFAQGLSGAGIAILYFTFFAAYSFYSLIPQFPAFVFMIIITAAAIVLSVRYDAISIATLGILGGFLTPVLLSGGSGGGTDVSKDTGVLIYIAILDLGILGITRFKSWQILNTLSLAGTVILFYCIAEANAFPLGLSIGFATLYYLIFATQAYVQNVITKRPLDSGDIMLAIVPAVLYFAYCYYQLVITEYRIFLGLLSVVMASVYAVTSHKIFLVKFEDRRLCSIYLSIASAFLIIAVPIQLNDLWIVWGWGIEAAVLSYIGLNIESQRTRTVALGIMGLAIISLLTQASYILSNISYYYIDSLYILTYLMLTAMIASIIYSYNINVEKLAENERKLVPDTLIITAAILMLIGLSTQLDITAYIQKYTVQTTLLITLLWLVYGLVAIVLGIYYKHRPIRIFALVLLGMTLAKTYIQDVWILEMGWRVVAFIALGCFLLIASYLYHKIYPQIIHFVSGDKDENEQL